MKKLFSIVAILMASLAVFSCAKEGFEKGEEATMNLSVQIPDIKAQTKAYGDGMYDDINLVIGVFDENRVEKFRRNITLEKGTFEKTVSIRFLMGKKYQMVLWAQYGDAYGDPNDPVEMPLDTITVDYTASNRENLDAFYAYVPVFEVKQDFEKSVTLRRPFAQLNFATKKGDVDASIADNYLGLPAKATVTVSSVANTLDLFTGNTSYIDPVTKAEAPGAKVVIPETAFPKDAEGKYPTITIENETYEVISMNYILVADSLAEKEGENAGKTTVNLTLNVGNELEIYVPTAHMKRNWKTNVIGQLLTGEGTFKVSVNPFFDNSQNTTWNELGN